MSYHLASHTLGSASNGLPTYYAPASSLHWSASSLRDLRNFLVSCDEQWHALWRIVPFEALEALPDVPEGLGDDLRNAISGPLPLAADIAIVLEIVAGGRPLVSSVQGILETMKIRAEEVASAFTVIGSVAASGALGFLVASAAGTASVVGAGVDIATLPSAATLGTIAALAGISAALWESLAIVLGGLEHGSLSESDYKTLVRAAATCAGKKVSDQDIANSADFFYGAQEQILHKRADAVAAAKVKSKRLLDACIARGGRYENGACRVPQSNVTKLEQQASGLRAQGQRSSIDEGVRSGSSSAVPYVVGGFVVGIGLFALLRRRKRES